MKKIVVLIFLFINLFAQDFQYLTNEPIQAIKIDETLDLKKVLLGEKLFFEKKLSKDNSISCLSCHNLDFGGSDNLSKSFGVDKRLGNFNSPTILNSSLNFVQFWDGRARTLKEQIDGPIHNKVEMDTNWKEIINKLKDIPSYKKMFGEIYDGLLNEENIKDAIVEFEKSLIAPSRFDRYLQGELNAITNEELEGYNLFKDYGCASCHQGQNVGGNFYEKLGVFKNYYDEKQNKNLGRYNITQNEENKFEFKVPSLRNIILTSPYLHDGSVKELGKVIQIMGEYQIGQMIAKDDIKKIEIFLKSLTSEKLEKRYDAKDF